MRSITRLAVVVALVVAACDGGGGLVQPDPRQELVDGINAQILANPDRSYDDAAARCLGEGIVDEFGVEGLAELGVTPDDPDLRGGGVFATQRNGRRVIDVGMECISVTDAIASFLPAGISLLDSSIRCVAEELQGETFRDLFAAIIVTGEAPTSVLDDSEARIPLGGLIAACLTGEEIANVGDLLP